MVSKVSTQSPCYPTPDLTLKFHPYSYSSFCFLFLPIGEELVTTTAGSEGTACSWPNIEYEFALSSGSLAYSTVQCTLLYRARLSGGFKVGHVTFPLSSLGIAPMESEVGLFICEDSPTVNGSQSSGIKDCKILPKKVVDAARRVEKEGRPGPRITLSIKLKDFGF